MDYGALTGAASERRKADLVAPKYELPSIRLRRVRDHIYSGSETQGWVRRTKIDGNLRHAVHCPSVRYRDRGAKRKRARVRSVRIIRLKCRSRLRERNAEAFRAGDCRCSGCVRAD